MNHHAYYFSGEAEEGIKHALAFGERMLGLSAKGNPDVIVFRYALFSVEEARKVSSVVHRMPVHGDRKLIIVSATRIFHETQNALLKIFEEPPEGTCIILVIPSDGVLIPTLRSRLVPLPSNASDEANSTIYSTVGAGIVAEFLKGGSVEREKIVAKLLDRAKSDTPEVKQEARTEALLLANGLTKAFYEKRNDPAVHAILSDLNRFIPILHERSAPLKLIFEHVLLTMPKGK